MARSGLIAQKTSTDDFYYLADGLGSTMAITDDIGAVVRDYTYDVYGQVTGGSGATPNEFDFAGQQSDDSTGLQYLRARYYDPATGVFISRDPLAAGVGWLGNPTGYVGANAVNLVDPLGLIGFRNNCAYGCWLKDHAASAGLKSTEWWIERWFFNGPTNSLHACRFVGEYVRCTSAGGGTDTDKAWGKFVDYFLTAITYRVPKGQRFDAVDVEATKNARAQLRGQHWTADDIVRVKSTAGFRGNNGTTGWLKRNSDGTFNWIVENSEGVVISVQKNASSRVVEMARGAFGWKIPPP